MSGARAGQLDSRVKTVLVAALTLLALSLALWPEFETPGLAMDEGTTLLYPELVTKGWVPYRDFETFYGPLNLWTLAGAYSALGCNVFIERLVGFGYQLAILLGIFFLTRRASLGVAAGSALCGAMLLRIAHVPAYAWVGGVACVIWSVVLLAEPGKWRALGGGALGAAAILYRPDLGPAVLLSAAPLCWRMSVSLRWRWLSGFALGLVPLAVLAVFAGPFNVLNNIFLFPVFHTSAGRRLPFGDAADWIQTLVFLHLGAVVFAIIAGSLTWKKRPQSAAGPVLVAAALLALGLTHQALQRVDSVHVVFAVFLSVALLPAAIYLLLRRGDADAPASWWRSLVSVTAAFVVVAISALPIVAGYILAVAGSVTDSKISSVFLQQGTRQFPFATPSQAVQTGKVLELLAADSKPGQRLFVGPGDLRRAYSNDTYLYHLAPWLTPATYYLEMNPGSANTPGSRLASDVATADWLVLNGFWDRWREPNASAQFGPDAPNEIVRTCFERVARFGEMDVYRRKTEVPAPVVSVR